MARKTRGVEGGGRPYGKKNERPFTADQREKIQKSKIFTELIKLAEGKADPKKWSPTRATVALGLAKKVLPDMNSITLAGDEDNPLKVDIDVRSALDEVIGRITRANERIGKGSDPEGTDGAAG